MENNFRVVGNLAILERPKYWRQIIGNRSVKESLLGMLASGNIRSTFLFSGDHGIGKTTLIRVLATTLNCENPNEDTLEPCGKCKSCQSMMQATPMSPDYHEIDCGSNGLVDNVRNIQSFVSMKPMHKFRIVCLDEAQNLTAQAQDAALKMLENPKPYLIFCIATTDPGKLKPTILSRCVQYNMTTPSVKANMKLLTRISDSNGVKIDPEILKNIIENNACHTRDCINTLGALLDSGDADALKSIDTFIASPMRRIISVSNSAQIDSMLINLFSGSTECAIQDWVVLSNSMTALPAINRIIQVLSDIVKLIVCNTKDVVSSFNLSHCLSIIDKVSEGKEENYIKEDLLTRCSTLLHYLLDISYKIGGNYSANSEAYMIDLIYNFNARI